MLMMCFVIIVHIEIITIKRDNIIYHVDNADRFQVFAAIHT